MTRKRIEVSIGQKAKLCAIKKSSNLKLKELKEIAQRDMGLDLGVSTLSEILKDELKWTNKDVSTRHFRLTPTNHIILEKSLIEWISRMDSINGFITEEVIIAKAKEFGEKLNIDDLIFSHGWLHRFKHRYNLKLRNLHGEAASMTDENVKQLRQEMSEKLEEIDPEYLLNFDETGLFFQAFPTRTIGSKEKK